MIHTIIQYIINYRFTMIRLFFDVCFEGLVRMIPFMNKSVNNNGRGISNQNSLFAVVFLQTIYICGIFFLQWKFLRGSFNIFTHTSSECCYTCHIFWDQISKFNLKEDFILFKTMLGTSERFNFSFSI
jgi:hypothetical protein